MAIDTDYLTVEEKAELAALRAVADAARTYLRRTRRSAMGFAKLFAETLAETLVDLAVAEGAAVDGGDEEEG